MLDQSGLKSANAGTWSAPNQHQLSQKAKLGETAKRLDDGRAIIVFNLGARETGLLVQKDASIQRFSIQSPLEGMQAKEEIGAIAIGRNPHRATVCLQHTPQSVGCRSSA